jgi:peptide/nickel transport system ATP-binding protein
MEQGRVVETAPPARLFGAPADPYTRRLVAASPTGHSVLPHAAQLGSGETLLEVSGLSKTYPDGTVAVSDVSFSIGVGESLGLVGESGSGKTTVSRLVTRLLDADAGVIRLGGRDIGGIAAREFHRAPERRLVQIVFQDAGDSLNPRFTAADAIADPLLRLGPVLSRAAVSETVADVARRCGLDAALLGRFPHQLSGGQKARVGIARALVVKPKLLVLDEPTAALDVSVQAVVLELLDRLRAEEGLSYLFVSHDLNVVRMLCARMVVMRHGVVVEEGLSDTVFRAPRTAYAAELIASIPRMGEAPAVVLR